MARKLYPIGIQTFEEIRRNDNLYIDKTEYVYRITHTDGKYFFLCRPRRFGKSLLVSTIKSYFEGKRELFEGLAIEKLEKEWKEYPVLLFSFAGGKHMEKEQLERYLLFLLHNNEERFGITCDSPDPNVRLLNLINKVYEITGKQVVVLIDEYDAPLLDVVHEDNSLEILRSVMRNFFSPLKDSDPKLRFVLLTGITKFSQLSIFSELNNIANISMDTPYSGICGITKDELLTQMSDDIDRLAESMGTDRESTIAKLKEYYDGYHFTWPSPDVFNPFSLLSCFAKQNIEAFWFASGTPTYLLEMLRKYDVAPSKIGDFYAPKTAFDAPTERMATITPLLYQSGYVTIKDYDKETELYHLDIPNMEIRIGLYENLLPYYLDRDTDAGRVVIARMSSLIKRGMIDDAMQLLKTFWETVPYCANTDYEGHYQQAMYIIFALLSHFRIQVEQHTFNGRTDITMETSDTIYIMELKFGKSAQDALDQINAKHYDKAFAMSGKKMVKMGISFEVDTNKNIIMEWIR